MPIAATRTLAGDQTIIRLAAITVIAFFVTRRTHGDVNAPNAISTPGQSTGIGAHIFVHTIRIIASFEALFTGLQIQTMVPITTASHRAIIETGVP